MKIEEYISELKKEKADIEKKIETIRYLKQLFPDLSYNVDRWRNIRYTSASVLSKADKVDIHHGCGCCEDAPLLARPHVEVYISSQSKSICVYSEPASFCIGEKNAYGYGDEPYSEWRKILKGASQSVIEKVEAYFRANKPSYETYDDDNYDYDY